jgi:hypothetical protein
MHLSGNISINITVDWGDSSSNVYTTSGQKSHTYAAAGTYPVIITGSLAGGVAATGVRFYRTGFPPYTSNKILSTTAITSVTGINLVNEMFYNSQISSIPSKMFQNCSISVAGQPFYATFYGCTNLTAAGIPADLFQYASNLTSSAFGSIFAQCTGLTTVPEDLFKYNTELGLDCFTGTFSGCSNISTIPVGLFQYNTKNTEFRDTFRNCDAITSIPADLFKFNVLTQSFNSTFNSCSLLASIPATLFDSQKTTATNFSYCFDNCTSLAGNAPTLWDSGQWTAVTTYTGCFRYAEGLSNYASIPNDWKGL